MMHILEDKTNSEINLYFVYIPNRFESSGWSLVGYPIDRLRACELAMLRLFEGKHQHVLVCHVTRDKEDINAFI
jgi:pyridoxal/pyridoxine/pyridoxamine kinase